MAAIDETTPQRVALGLAASGGQVTPIDAANPLPMSAPVQATAGGLTTFRRLATADTNAAIIKAAAGRVYGYTIANPSAAAKFVRLYNKATAPNPAADNALIVRTIMIPAGGIASYHLGAGMAGFTNGIGIAATGAIGDTDATALAANDLIIHVDYA